MSALGGQTPGAPPPPATRTLSVVLREALARGEEVRMLVAKALADSANPLPNANAYMNIELEGQSVTVPKVAASGLGGSSSGYAVYVLATPDFLLALGTVAGSGGGGSGGGIVPIGAVMQWPTNSPPAGWLICNGSSFSSATYPDLAAVLGSTTLPDYRRRVLVGAGTGGYSIGNGDGQAEGSRGIAHHHRVSLGTDTQGDHTHGAVGDHQHGSLGSNFADSIGGIAALGSGGSNRNLVNNYYPQTAAAGAHQHPNAGAHTHSVNGDTSGGGAQDAPSWTVVNFIIRAL